MKQAGWTAPQFHMPVLSGSASPGALDVSLASHLPLVGLAGSDLAQRFRWWRGASGRRYMFSVIRLGPERPHAGRLDAEHRGADHSGHDARLDHCPRYDAAVVLAVACGAEGQRRILCMDETGALPDLFFGSDRLRQALQHGANEIHVHLLAEAAADRRAILRDLEG